MSKVENYDMTYDTCQRARLQIKALEQRICRNSSLRHFQVGSDAVILRADGRELWLLKLTKLVVL